MSRRSLSLACGALATTLLAGCGPLDSGSSATEIPAGELPAKVEKLAGTISSQQFGSVLVRGNYVTFTYQSGEAWKSAGGQADGEVANEQDEDDLPHYKPAVVSGLGLQKLASSMKAVDYGSDKKAGRVESSPTGALVTSVGC